MKPSRFLVTGAGGFVGGALLRALRSQGHAVRALARRPLPDSEDVEVVLGDIRDGRVLEKACREIDVVIHTAAKAGGWGAPAEYESINLHGTEALLAASRSAGVRGFVYTSSPSVVFDKKDIEAGGESLPYARSFLAHYPRTKALAEKRVLTERHFPTVALRPHLIWGPGDRHLLPRLLSRGKRLKRVGFGDPLTDTTYIDNCVHAHLLAASRVVDAPEAVAGKAYSISDDEPIGMWTMANRLLEAAGAPPIRGRIPVPLAYAAATILEGCHLLAGSDKEPLITRFAVAQFAKAQWYDLSAAKRDLGYRPLVTIEDGLKRLRSAYAESVS